MFFCKTIRLKNKNRKLSWAQMFAKQQTLFDAVIFRSYSFRFCYSISIYLFFSYYSVLNKLPMTFLLTLTNLQLQTLVVANSSILKYYLCILITRLYSHRLVFFLLVQLIPKFLENDIIKTDLIIFFCLLKFRVFFHWNYLGNIILRNMDDNFVNIRSFKPFEKACLLDY